MEQEGIEARSARRPEQITDNEARVRDLVELRVAGRAFHRGGIDVYGGDAVVLVCGCAHDGCEAASAADLEDLSPEGFRRIREHVGIVRWRVYGVRDRDSD